jgi:hypothetical protein
MKTKILVTVLACVSVAAIAQQSGSGQTKATAVTAPSDAANSKITGKKGYDHYKAQSDGQAKGATGSNDASSGQATAVRESPSKATLKATTDDQTTAVRESPTKASTSRRESPTKSTPPTSAGDSSGRNSVGSEVKSPRDISSGQSSGKRQHQDISIVKKSDAAPKN